MRHKSTVYCDFRPRPRSFSETAWVFPKQGREIYISAIEYQLLVDTSWYKSQVSIADETGSEISDLTATAMEDEMFQTMRSSGYATSSAGSTTSSEDGDIFSDQLHSPTYNNNEKRDYYKRYGSSRDKVEQGQYV